MIRFLKIAISIPRTLWFNIHYLPARQAVKFPIWIANNVRIKELHRGCLELHGKLKVGLIRIGYHEADGVDTCSVHTVINVAKSGRLVFKNDAHIGQGAIIRVNDNGKITFGDNFAISGTTSIIASKSITFGDDVQLSWNSLIMDSDAHKIFDSSGNWINQSKEINIGNKVWIAANTTIMKGVNIADNVIIAANSMVNKSFAESGVIIGGQPARPIKKFAYFTI